MKGGEGMGYGGFGKKGDNDILLLLLIFIIIIPLLNKPFK
jgi:hypothetical protein